MEFQVRHLVLFRLFLVKNCFRWFWMGNLHKNIQLMMVFLKAPFLVLLFSYLFLPTFMTLLVMLSVILRSCWWHFSLLLMWSGIWSVATIRIGFLTWIWSTRPRGPGQGVVCWFNARKTQLVSFDRSNNTGATDAKMDGSVLEEKSSFEMPGLTFFFKLDWDSYIISIAKTSPRKLLPWFVLWSLFLVRLLCISINLPCGLTWNTVVISWLVRLVATWNCYINYKNVYVGLWVLYLLPVLNPWLIIKM